MEAVDEGPAAVSAEGGNADGVEVEPALNERAE